MRPAPASRSGSWSRSRTAEQRGSTAQDGAPPQAAVVAPAEAPPLLASIYVGYADDGQFSGVVDVLTLGQPAAGWPSAVDEDDPMAVGDLVGDSADEVVAIDDVEGRLDMYDGRTGTPRDTFPIRFNSEEDGLAVGACSATRTTRS
jgi:hypothetical protein